MRQPMDHKGGIIVNRNMLAITGSMMFFLTAVTPIPGLLSASGVPVRAVMGAAGSAILIAGIVRNRKNR